MRRSHVATALVVLTTGLAASAAIRRLVARRRPASAPVAAALTAPVPDRDTVVVPFARRVVAAPVPERSASTARCGDSGGRTKAGAPCAARATSGGRCHHHPMAA
jgi:hypothetical protein